MGLLRKLAVTGTLLVGLNSQALADDNVSSPKCENPEIVISGASDDIIMASLDGDCTIDQIHILDDDFKKNGIKLVYKNQDNISSKDSFLGDDYLKSFSEYLCKRNTPCEKIDDGKDVRAYQKFFMAEVRERRLRN